MKNLTDLRIIRDPAGTVSIARIVFDEGGESEIVVTKSQARMLCSDLEQKGTLTPPEAEHVRELIEVSDLVSADPEMEFRASHAIEIALKQLN